MEPTSFLQQYGFSVASLSPDVKDGIMEVIKAGTREGLQQLGQILAKQAQKNGINTGSGTAASKAAQDEAIRAAQAEYERLEAEKKAKKRKQILLAVGAAVLVIGIVIAVVLTRKKKNQ